MVRDLSSLSRLEFRVSSLAFRARTRNFELGTRICNVPVTEVRSFGRSSVNNPFQEALRWLDSLIFLLR
jgi:hypothetical protein